VVEDGRSLTVCDKTAVPVGAATSASEKRLGWRGRPGESTAWRLLGSGVCVAPAALAHGELPRLTRDSIPTRTERTFRLRIWRRRLAELLDDVAALVLRHTSGYGAPVVVHPYASLDLGGHATTAFGPIAAWAQIHHLTRPMATPTIRPAVDGGDGPQLRCTVILSSRRCASALFYAFLPIDCLGRQEVRRWPQACIDI
jgi:hypothetical protein